MGIQTKALEGKRNRVRWTGTTTQHKRPPWQIDVDMRVQTKALEGKRDKERWTGRTKRLPWRATGRAHHMQLTAITDL